MKKIYQLACIAMAALVLIGGCKDEEHQPLPADAGTISGATANACPEKTVGLSVNAVAEATAYVWYRNGAAIADASGLSYTVTQSGSYTVAGKNEEGEGKPSPVHVVTITPCPGDDGGVPADAGTIEGGTENECPSRTVDLSVEPITGASSYSWHIARAEEDVMTLVTVSPELTASLSGSYTVAGKNEEGEGNPSPVHVVSITPCPGDDGGVPADAGTIIGPEVNDCPSRTADLSVEPITGATAYQWNIAYAEDDIETAITTEPAYTADFSNLFGENQSVTYTVNGVNEAGLGKASPPHVVTKRACTPEKPVILGNPDWIESTDNNLTVYRTLCPATNMAGTATTTSEDVTHYQWYWQLVGTDPELKEWDTYGGAELTLGGRGYTYNFAVVAINADGESPMSDVIQVIGSSCFQPNRPGGVGGNVALFPTATGFFPVAPNYSYGLSNCDIQEVTGQIETGVELTCNAAVATDPDYPVLSYSFWVKTTEGGEFTKVFTSTGTTGAARTFIVDGVTYPSGTYQVTAASADGDSEFGNNWIAVTIRTDCPPPAVVLPPPTFSGRRGGVYNNGTFTNNCGTATITLDINIPGTPSGSLTDITWRQHPGMEVVRSDGETTRTDWSVANNGTYTVTYTKIIDGTPHESQGAEIVINLTLCTPTFATKPTAIVSPATYAEAVLNEPDAASAPHITGYEWYYNGAPATSAEVTAATATRTYHLFEEGTYTVRATSAYGNSPFSEEIVLTKVSAPTAYTRDDLLGTYDVSDWKRSNAGGSAVNYTLTITAGEGENDLVIVGLGGIQSSTWYTTLNATVAFLEDGATTGNYGTISIPVQSFPSGATGTTTHYLKHGTNYNNPPQCDNNAIEFTIKFVNGNPGVSQTGINYGIVTQASACGGINYYYGARSANANGQNDVVTWIKQ